MLVQELVADHLACLSILALKALVSVFHLLLQSQFCLLDRTANSKSFEQFVGHFLADPVVHLEV